MRMRVLCTFVALAAAVSAHADTRTTPVAVTNPVAIDQTRNTVQATQSGAWAVGVTGTPTVTIANSPTVNLGNSPTVKIDSSANGVKTATQSSLVRLFSSDTAVANGSAAYSSTFSTSGFKEMRVLVMASIPGGSPDKVSVRLDIFAFNSSWTFGTANFAAPAHQISEQGNFTQGSGTCMFSVPIYSDTYRICVYNTSGSSITVMNNSLVYLVN